MTEPRRTSPALSSAAFVLAVLSVFTCFILYLCIPLGALSIILALLSRGAGRAGQKVRITLVLAALSMAASVTVTSYAAYRIYHTPELKAQFERILDYLMYEERNPFYSDRSSLRDSSHPAAPSLPDQDTALV